MTEDVYQGLISWLKKNWFGLPDSEHLPPAVRAAYTPEEAELLTGFPWKGHFLEEIAELKGTSPEEIRPKLEAAAAKGLIWRSAPDGRLRYSLNDPFFVFMRSLFWPTDKPQAASDAAGPFNRYYFDGFMDRFAHARLKGLRTLPIDRTIGDARTVAPYEDVVKVVEDREYYSVSECPCRSRKMLDPDSEACDMPMEVCLHFDGLGRYIVENGLGREISREETMDILRRAADAGLVHGLTNWREKPDTICNCCSCCCLFLEAYHKLGHHRSLDPSNYVLQINPATCQACGLCRDRCPMEAVRLESSAEAANKQGRAPVLEAAACIGCGVCVHKCPTGSLDLVRREETSEPPASARDWMKSFMTDKESGPKLRPGK